MLKRKFALLVLTLFTCFIVLGSSVGRAAPTPANTNGNSNPLDTISSTTVTSSDGLHIYAEETGNPQGQPVLFVHGILQSRLAWDNQFSDPSLRAKYHMIRFDLRGHGNSDKPVDLAHYTAQLYADDIEAVIKTLHLSDSGKKPVVVGWSLGGTITTYYIHYYGQSEIAGLGYIDSAPSPFDANGNILFSPDLLMLTPALFNPAADTTTFVDSTKSFVSLLTDKPLTPELFYEILGYNLDVPAAVRSNLLTSNFAAASVVNGNADFAAIKVPLLIVQGQTDRLIPASTATYLKSLQPNAQLIIYPNVGHSPFLEVTDTFNKDLQKFVTQATNGSGNQAK